MPSSKASAILRSKTDLNPSEIEALSEIEAWALIRKCQTKKEVDHRLEVCFTGFQPLRKEELKLIASQNNLKVVMSVTKNLYFLVTGEAPGESKVKKASAQNAHILEERAFLNFIETGEIN